MVTTDPLRMDKIPQYSFDTSKLYKLLKSYDYSGSARIEETI
jgi:hypothetical protein